MDWQALGRIEQRLQQTLVKLVGSLVEFSIFSTASAMGDQDAAQTEDDNTTDGRPVRRTEVWGFRGRPKTTGVRGLIFRILGGDSGFMVGIITDNRWGPVDLDDGESAQYSGTNPAVVRAFKDGSTKITSTKDDGTLEASLTLGIDGSISIKSSDGLSTVATIVMDTNGRMTLTSSSGNDIRLDSNGGKIWLNNNTKGAARQGHGVGNGTIKFTLTDPAGTTGSAGSPISFSTAGQLEVKYTPGDGSSSQDETAKGDGSATATVTVMEEITGGSASVKMIED